MPRTAPFALLLATLVAVPGSAGAAERDELRVARMTEPASPGLPVSGPLSANVAVSRASVSVPTTWSRLKAPAGRLRYRVRRGSSCTFTLTFRVRSVVLPTQDPEPLVAEALPAATARHLLDSGSRGADRAFRVVRTSTPGRARVDALWMAPLTRRTDIVPMGRTAWTQVRVTAVSRQGDECHAGTWRTLGPAIGDALAVARTDLRFVKSRPRPS